MKVITLANHKGGCAKTTTAMNLSVVLASEGARVLNIDLDPQGNLSTYLGADLNEVEHSQRTSLRMLMDKRGEYRDYLYPVRPRIDLIPSCLDPDAETLLEGVNVCRDTLLKKKLEQIVGTYDYCIIDTPPALRAPTLNALVCANLIVIPIEASLFSVLGLTQLLRTIGDVIEAHSIDPYTMGLSTMFSPRQMADKAVRNTVRQKLHGNMFEAAIPRATSVTKAQMERKSVYETDPTSQAAFSFFQLATEIRELYSDGENNVGLTGSQLGRSNQTA